MVMIRTLPRVSLGTGNRIVQTFTNGVVVKFGCPNAPATGGQNKIEAATWRLLKDKPGVRDVLMPVLDYARDGSWLYMPQALSNEEWTQKEKNALRERAEAFGLETVDMHNGNIRYNSAGTLVMIDYGFKVGAFDKAASRCSGCEWARLLNGRDRMHVAENICMYCWKEMTEKDDKKLVGRGHNKFLIHRGCW
jgi:hypothetical protein